jgi:hypothetical protein
MDNNHIDSMTMLQTQLATAGFFVDGLMSVQPTTAAMLQSWDKGYFELVAALVAYAPLTTSIGLAAAKAADNNYPGVFDYEVSTPFGRWFGSYVLLHGDEPPKDVAHDWLVNEIAAFFHISKDTFAPEIAIRSLWTSQGVSVEKQNDLLGCIAAKASEGSMVGPFRIGGNPNSH